jgi:hypothetical protein
VYSAAATQWVRSPPPPRGEALCSLPRANLQHVLDGFDCERQTSSVAQAGDLVAVEEELVALIERQQLKFTHLQKLNNGSTAVVPVIGSTDR